MRLIKSDTSGQALSEAVRVLEEGGAVACATETYYGLCARYDDEAALDRLYALKGARRAAKPFPLIIGSEEALGLLVSEITPLFAGLAKKFWPGPLTLVARARPGLSHRIAAGGKVALRMPGASFALELARACGMPLTATSANPSGEKPANSAAQVIEYFGGAVELAVDSGDSPGGPPSTIIDATGEIPVLLREGAIGFGEIVASCNL